MPDDATVITLIAPDHLPDDIVRTIAAQCSSRIGWLRPHFACDIFVADHNIDDVRRMTMASISTQPIDAIVQPAKGRRKKLLLADMDSTIVTSETLDELAEYAGVGSIVAGITARAMNGDIEFEQALRERVLLLRDLPDTTLHAVWQRTQLASGARTLVQTMKQHDAHCVLISGGFSYFTQNVMQLCGFDCEISNQLEIVDGVLTGQVIPPIIDRHAKLTALHTMCAERAIDPGQAATIGDGANDIPMLQAAGLGMAYHGKPIVRNAVPHQLNYSDLTGLLYAQGYVYDDFKQ